MGKRQVIVATFAHTYNNRRTVEAVFPVWSVLKLYNEDQLPLLFSCEPVKGDIQGAAIGEFSPGADS
jgi:hypothetical protein